MANMREANTLENCLVSSSWNVLLAYEQAGMIEKPLRAGFQTL